MVISANPFSQLAQHVEDTEDDHDDDGSGSGAGARLI